MKNIGAKADITIKYILIQVSNHYQIKLSM